MLLPLSDIVPAGVAHHHAARVRLKHESCVPSCSLLFLWTTTGALSQAQSGVCKKVLISLMRMMWS